MKQAVETLGVQPAYLLVDAEKVDIELPQLAIIKGDARSQSIAAASILAKVTRDRLCRDEWDELYPHTALPYIKATQPSCTGKSFWSTVRVRCTGKVFWGSCSRTSRCCSRG